MSAGDTCGGSGSSLFIVSAIFNSAFIVGYPASNGISILEGGALKRLNIPFAACLKKFQLYFWKSLFMGYKSNCVTVAYVCFLEK